MKNARTSRFIITHLVLQAFLKAFLLFMRSIVMYRHDVYFNGNHRKLNSSLLLYNVPKVNDLSLKLNQLFG
ncbi:MAG: hypothetical protein K1X55_14225 [Chitinophagales bacterium]|nr:hypothetical protein [Chitinophagales bacterium]